MECFYLSAVSSYAKLLKWKQITTGLWINDTKRAVSSYAKLLKWKQITTFMQFLFLLLCCKFLCKVTKMKANHNLTSSMQLNLPAVSSYAKLLKWKQITTLILRGNIKNGCKFLCKVTKMKANHNLLNVPPIEPFAVSSYAKLLKWKQITTAGELLTRELKL